MSKILQQVELLHLNFNDQCKRFDGTNCKTIQLAMKQTK